MKKQYCVVLKCGIVFVKEADSLAELIEMMKVEEVEYRDVALIWCRVEIYDYHWG